jgi:hypothetical protein
MEGKKMKRADEYDCVGNLRGTEIAGEWIVRNEGAWYNTATNQYGKIIDGRFVLEPVVEPIPVENRGCFSGPHRWYYDGLD